MLPLYQNKQLVTEQLTIDHAMHTATTLMEMGPDVDTVISALLFAVADFVPDYAF